VPDQRFTFDRFRQRSPLGPIIDLHLDPRPVHTVGTMADFAMNAVNLEGRASWEFGHSGTYKPVYGLDLVKQQVATAGRQDSYIDMHHWVFTPNHLRLLLADLHALGFISVREETFHPTVGHEFFLNLSPTGEGPGLSRQELLTLADDEVRSFDPPNWQ
jgi:hypothetical protein